MADTNPDQPRRDEADHGGALGRLATSLAALGRGWRAPWWLPPVVLAWLVLSTIWGFGRAAYPDVADRFLVAGLLAAGATGGALLVLRRPGRGG